MKIMIKRYDNTKVQFDWIELNTDKQGFKSLNETGEAVLNVCNSGVKSPRFHHDIVIEVKTIKEFKKQERDLMEYAKRMFDE